MTCSQSRNHAHGYTRVSEPVVPHLCSCGFATDDHGWLEAHLVGHLGRDHDVSAMTAGELERARRDLTVSLALTRPGSPVRVPILARLSAVSTALAARAAGPDHLGAKR